jgi:glyoxylase-like metal-dependent hydrolase (beta-lactamase superfamily II)
VEPDSIDVVVNTHLHFDHAGGNTELNEAGKAVPAFRNARYFIARAEVAHADEPSERDRASYLPDNWQPLVASGQLELQPADYEVAPGVRMETYAGHNRSMQCWRLQREGQTLFGFADLVPMRAHVPLAWIMGYDLYPAETLAVKKQLLPQAAREVWTCLFYHDPDEPLCKLVEEDGKLRAEGCEL